MEQLETIAFLQQRYAMTVTQVENFASTHQTLLQAMGVVTAVTLGGVAGFWLAKGVLFAKAGLATQALPLAVGLASGTLAGVGYTRHQVQRMQGALAAQTVQLAQAQDEYARLLHLLDKTS